MEPEELLLAALLRRAIKDAQGKQERTRIEAARWLRTFAPTIANRLQLPQPAPTMPVSFISPSKKG